MNVLSGGLPHLYRYDVYGTLLLGVVWLLSIGCCVFLFRNRRLWGTFTMAAQVWLVLLGSVVTVATCLGFVVLGLSMGAVRPDYVGSSDWASYTLAPCYIVSLLILSPLVGAGAALWYGKQGRRT